MKFEYDLVVIGSTDEAVYATKKALELKKRVALVCYDSVGEDRLSELIFRRTHHKILSLLLRGKEYPFCWENDLKSWLKNSKIWNEEVIKNLSECRSKVNLTALGVDVIEGCCEFFRLPELGIRTEARELKSRSYLLATGSKEVDPEIEGLSTINHIKDRNLWQKNLLELRENILIIGTGEKSLEIAQILNALGKKVFLATENDNLLPWEEAEIVILLQKNLEAEGITIYTKAEIRVINESEDKKWVCIDRQEIAVDEIITIDPPHPNFEGLNLDGVKVKYNTHRIEVDRTLKTSNSRIYAAGDILGGYNSNHLSRYEVDIALKNALTSFNLFPRSIDYNYLPIVIHTEPKLARVGMTELQARKYFGDDIQVIRQELPKSIQEAIEDRSPTFCKLILRDDREILGVHLLGDRSTEIIESIALAIKHKIRFDRDLLLLQ
jgi:pyruvate/2-oxoglutarate dehydrogenase complex dihydrolipoamide dehydrogenase (E3) component